MSESSSANDAAITMDQLVALNDEMAALARAGVPLDKGLLHLGLDLPGRLGEITRNIGYRLAQGEPLVRVLGADQGLPPAYRAVVAAGVRSGRLAVALEGMSGVIRRAADMQRVVIVSLIYPFVVLAVAHGLLTFSVLKTLPVILAAYQEFAPPTIGLSVLQWLARTGPHWLPWLPPAFGALMILLWRSSRDTWSLGGGKSLSGRSGRRSRFPTPGNLMHNGRMATFCDTLALLLEHEVPMDESLCLAADASGEPGLQIACRRQAERITRGEFSVAADVPETPPVLGWLLTEVRDEMILISALRRLSESYRRHADWMMRWLSLYLPVLLMAFIGGAVVFFYALVVVGPWAQLLCEMSLP